MCAQPMRSSHSCCCPIASLRTAPHRTRAIARSARARDRSLGALARSLCARAIARWGATSLAGRATSRAARASHRSLARAIARWCATSLAGRATSRAARASSAGRSARGTRACARCARGCAHLCEAARVVAQLACCPHATALARPSPMPIRSLLVAHDTRQGCCLVLVHYALAHCIRAARATSSLARRRMPALYNTP